MVIVNLLICLVAAMICMLILIVGLIKFVNNKYQKLLNSIGLEETKDSKYLDNKAYGRFQQIIDEFIRLETKNNKNVNYVNTKVNLLLKELGYEYTQESIDTKTIKTPARIEKIKVEPKAKLNSINKKK